MRSYSVRYSSNVYTRIHWMVAVQMALFAILSQKQQSYGGCCCAFLYTFNSAATVFKKLPASSLTTGPLYPRRYTMIALASLSKRELEIRRKIRQLKNDGRLKKRDDNLFNEDNDDDDDDDDDNDDGNDEYIRKIRQKLGPVKSKLLGFDADTDVNNESDDTVDNSPTGNPVASQRRQGRVGAISTISNDEETSGVKGYQRIEVSEKMNFDIESGDDSYQIEDEIDEDDLVELVAIRLQEPSQRIDPKKAELDTQNRANQSNRIEQPTNTSSKRTISGVGGSWDGNSKTEAEQDIYQPKTGSWGAFPRPRDISRAYGGGRRIGPGYSNENLSSVDQTRQKLQQYRVKVGIEVQSEKENAAIIDEALNIASVAMQRGMYSTAVSALEKVTKYCSTNSKVGGKVFLELAMAYEAVGRTREAITVYTTLSRSRIEEIKINAKRLLYGIEAMQFMRDNIKSSEFSRTRAKRTFIDTTGLDNIASHFDDVYETSYIDLDRGYYKKLTENVVRNSREARQILLRATGPGEVERMKVVQALRSFNRRFTDALYDEMERSNASTQEPTAIMDGKPILKTNTDEGKRPDADMEDFVLMDPEQMLLNLSGKWRLQLLADKRGEGVTYFNTSVAWQQLDTDAMSFQSVSPQGILTIEQQGKISFNSKQRILQRNSVQVTGGGAFAELLSAIKYGAVGAITTERQVITVDSMLLITRGVSQQSSQSNDDNVKNYFAVWRRI